MDSFAYEQHFYFMFGRYECDLGVLLQSLLKHCILAESNVSALMAQLLNALFCLKEAGVVHLDIKLVNIFLRRVDENRRTLVLADFGLAKFASKAQ